MPSMKTVYGNAVIAELVIAGNRPASLDFKAIRNAAGVYIDEATTSPTGIMPAVEFAAVVAAAWPEWVNER